MKIVILSLIIWLAVDEHRIRLLQERVDFTGRVAASSFSLNLNHIHGMAGERHDYYPVKEKGFWVVEP